MLALSIILAVVDIMVCLLLIFLVIIQEGQDRGMGALTGATMDTFYSKQGGRTRERVQKRATFILSIVFVVLTIVLYALVSR